MTTSDNRGPNSGRPLDAALNNREKKRFFGCIEKGEEEKSCWKWNGLRNKHGYGRFFFRGSYQAAHRVSYATHIGPIPAGACVLHNCDNASCQNPKHLFLGSQSDNMEDMYRKGRGNRPTGDRQWTRIRPQDVTWKGEANFSSKLTEEQVIKIRALYEAKQLFQREIAAMFDITQTLVSQIVRRRSWKHVK